MPISEQLKLFQVDLHMRYIQLQRILQSKMNELEKLCVRERQLLEGKWKTHSLPARKKASQTNNGDPTTPTQSSYSTYCNRPTLSTEDVAKAQPKATPPTLILAYQYLDPRYHYMLQPRKTASGEYLLTFEQPRYKNDDHHFIVKTPCNPPPKQTRSSQASSSKSKKIHETCHGYAGHLCSPCIQSNSSNADNTSLEAYDLASPCCDPHCVPSSRRRSKTQKDIKKRDSKSEETQTEPQHPQQRSRPQSQTSQASQTMSTSRRYFQIGAGLVSQCSLHSCTSSELSGIAPTTTGESTGSYTTSLSTDTLYWDGSGEAGTSRQVSLKSNSKHEQQQRYQQTHDPIYVQYNTVKPKSWDNLATKAFGGYGFGYGYIDTTPKCSSSSKNRTQKSHTATQYVRITSSDKHNTTNYPNQPQYIQQHTQRRYFHPTKSTESLLSVPKYSSEALSDSSISCECLDNSVSPGPDTAEGRFFQSPRQSVVSPTDPNFGYYSVRSSRSDYPKSSSVVTTSSEATRL